MYGPRHRMSRRQPPQPAQDEPPCPAAPIDVTPYDDGPIATALRNLLPPGVAQAIWAGDAEPALYPEEARSVEGVVDKRAREFRRGRACAREALASLGLPPVALPVGPDRAPVWPPGYIGSITHCSGLVAAVAARTGEAPALGVDAEIARALPGDTRSRLLHPSERRIDADPVLETVVFSAKEAIHKALFPLSGVRMDFLDVVVRLDHERGRFAVAAAPDAASSAPRLSELQGRFAVVGGFVLTLTYLGGT